MTPDPAAREEPAMESVRDVAALIGRILLAAIFVLSGLGKFINMSAFVGMTSAHFARAGIPPTLVIPGLYLSAIVEVGCGLLLIAGLKARWAALIVFLWLIPVTLVFHVADYSQAVQQHQAMNAVIQQVMYMKNLAIMGGLLLLAAMGPGGLSLDARSGATAIAPARHAA
jgi:putative oxidoreductase